MENDNRQVGGMKQPRNIFEQILFGMTTINENILDLYKMVGEIHSALYSINTNSTNSPEPKVLGGGEEK